MPTIKIIPPQTFDDDDDSIYVLFLQWFLKQQETRVL